MVKKGELYRESKEEKLSRTLRQRVHEAMVYLGVPDWYEVKYEQATPNRICGHLWKSTSCIDDFSNLGKHDTANHVARVTLDSLAVSDFLGLSDQKYNHSRETLVAAAYDHDSGKAFPELRPLIEKKIDFTSDDVEKMREHVNYSLIFQNDKDVASVIGHHHNWQKRPYSYDRKGKFSLTPETEVLSKLLAIIDFHDSGSTRANTRFSETPRLPTKDELKNLLINEYGELPLVYDGEQLPKLNMTGGDLIEDLYLAGIFGRDDPINPYPKPYSFVRRPSSLQTFVERTKARKREFDVQRKRKHYSKLESKKHKDIPAI